MDAQPIEYHMALDTHKREQKEMQAIVARMLGKYGEPTRPLREARRQISKKLGGAQVSQLIIEAR